MAHRMDHFAQEADAVFEITSVFVLAVVGEGREEFVDQVAVGTVDFNDLKTSGQRTAGCGGEGGDKVLHFWNGERVGNRVAFAEGDGAGGDNLPAVGGSGWNGGAAIPGELATGFAAGMGELDGGNGALGLQKSRDAGEGGYLVVRPEAEVAVGDSPAGLDGSGLDNHKAGTTGGAAAEVHQMPVVGEAINARVLAHGRDGNPVWKGDSANREGREQTARHFLYRVVGMWIRFAWIALLTAPVWGQAAKPERFAATIAAFVENDKVNPPPKGGILFIGSSIFRQWKNLGEQMAPLPVFNRAFGGSQTNDILHYMDQVVLPYAPRIIVYYCGSNDVNAGIPASEITLRYSTFVDRVHEKLPETRIFMFLSTGRRKSGRSGMWWTRPTRLWS